MKPNIETYRVILAMCLLLLTADMPLQSQEPSASVTPTETAAVEPNTPQMSGDASAPAQTPRSRRRARFSPEHDISSMHPESAAKSDTEDPNVPMEAINLNNVEMRQIIQKIADWIGKPVIPVNDEIMQARITIYSPAKVTRQQALSLLIRALLSKGIVVEELQDRVMLRPLASIRLGSVPTLGPDEPLARIEDKTQIVEKWFRLTNYSPTRLVQIIAPLTADYGYAIADEGSSRVGVIDTVDNLMRIERLILQLDIPESEQEIEQVFELKYADPMEVVQMLQLILGENRSSRRSGNASAPPGGSRPTSGNDVKTAATVVIDSGGTTSIRLLPLVKQRWILARGSKADIRRIEEWMQRLDLKDLESGTEEMRQTVVQVRYADVREVVKMVQNTLQQMPGTQLRANIVVEALPQTGQIVIYGSEVNRTTVERLIAQIDLPKENVFSTQNFQLKHADPDQIKKNIEALYSDSANQQYRYSYWSSPSSRQSEDTVKVISYPMLKQVTVIATAPNMVKIAKLIDEEWDKPLDIEKDQYRIITLKNSDPVQLADLLKKLFSEESGNNNQNFLRMLFWGYGGDTASRQKIIGSLYGVLTFEPVPETKKIIVISQIPEAYDVIDRLVTKLDGNEETEVPRIITLNYADPEALCDQLNAILNEAGTLATIPRSARGLSAYDATKTTQAVTVSIDAGENNASTITPWWTRQRLDSTKLPTSNLIGRVRFVPVHRSKAILTLAPLEYITDIEKMIKELDRPGMQVMIKAVIVEIGLSDMTSLGVQVASNPAAFGSLGPNALTALNNLTYVEERTNFSAAIETDISVLVDLLVKHANGRVLNQPTLWTKDNEEAFFVKGQKVGFVTGQQTQDTGSTQQTVNFENVGITLRVRPNITPEKAVDLTISLNVSSLEPETVNNQVVRKNLETTTNMIVNDGQSVMMGGILYQDDTIIVNKLPLLGDLPLVGRVFRHEKTSQTNNELLVFITPYVVDEALLKKIPANPNSHEVLEESRQRVQDTADSLNRLFRRSPETLPETDSHNNLQP
jgi:general secretion pathway protein D